MSMELLFMFFPVEAVRFEIMGIEEEKRKEKTNEKEMEK